MGNANILMVILEKVSHVLSLFMSSLMFLSLILGLKLRALYILNKCFTTIYNKTKFYCHLLIMNNSGFHYEMLG